MRRRLRELAKDRPAFGVRRWHTMLRRDGLAINLKKVRRLYLEEQLQLKPRRQRRRAGTVRQSRAEVTCPTERWAMDFMHDVLVTGQHVRVFTLVDVFSPDGVALEVAPSFTGAAVARLLSDAGERTGGLPSIIQCDNGTEFTSTALDHWAYWNRVQLDFSRLGKLVDNSVCEAFNGSLRRECLTRHWFASVLEAQTELSTWRADDSNLRPYTSFGMHPQLNSELAGTTNLGRFAKKLTLSPGPTSGTQAEVWSEAKRLYDEASLATLVMSIATVNMWNRLNAATRQVAGE